MPNCRTGPSSTFTSGKAPGSAHTSKKGKSAGNKASSAQNRASTNASGFTAEKMAFYKTHTQREARKTVATAAEDEGMSILTLPSYFGS